MAQSVKPLTLDFNSRPDLRVMGSSLVLGSTKKKALFLIFKKKEEDNDSRKKAQIVFRKQTHPVGGC